jgi:hypothetical protein
VLLVHPLPDLGAARERALGTGCAPPPVDLFFAQFS